MKRPIKRMTDSPPPITPAAAELLQALDALPEKQRAAAFVELTAIARRLARKPYTPPPRLAPSPRPNWLSARDAYREPAIGLGVLPPVPSAVERAVEQVARLGTPPEEAA